MYIHVIYGAEFHLPYMYVPFKVSIANGIYGNTGHGRTDDLDRAASCHLDIAVLTLCVSDTLLNSQCKTYTAKQHTLSHIPVSDSWTRQFTPD